MKKIEQILHECGKITNFEHSKYIFTMAKSKAFFGLRRGSTKSLTFTVLKGQQITKDRVTECKNPRTQAQMYQRAKFASLIAFYKEAQQNLFTFAYEDKKTTESYYNAFVRKNMNEGLLLTKAQCDNMYVPKYSSYIMSDGTLPRIDADAIEDAHFNIARLVTKVEDLVGGEGLHTTIGTITKCLMRYNPDLQEGDFITFVSIVGDASHPYSETAPYISACASMPYWRIYQIKLDSTSEVNPSFITSGNTDGVNIEITASLSKPTDLIYCACVIASRKTDNGIKVSKSLLSLNENAPADVITGYDNTNTADHPLGTDWADFVVASWGADSTAILDGSLVDQE